MSSSPSVVVSSGPVRLGCKRQDGLELEVLRQIVGELGGRGVEQSIEDALHIGDANERGKPARTEVGPGAVEEFWLYGVRRQPLLAPLSRPSKQS